MSSASWNFLEKQPHQANVDGNISRLFNTGESRPPACFSRVVDRKDTSAISAVIYGREGIANCVDASPAAQNGSGKLGLEFVFEKFTGLEAREYWDKLGLGDLAQRANHPQVKRGLELGLGEDDCLSRGKDAALRILTVIESGGGGMPGSLSDPDSVLVRALMNVGEAQSRAGAAGSYGFGKAAVAQASRPRVVLVYTCSRPLGNTDRVTRRFLGITYWGMHRIEEKRYTGWGLFGKRLGTAIESLEDTEADEMARSLGIPVRSMDNPEDLGTTFMIIDPDFTAEQLKGSVELFWWPLLQGTRDFQLDLSIWNEDGNKLPIQVDVDHRELGQFVSSFKSAESARKTREGFVEDRRVVQFGDAGITSLEVKNADSIVDGSLIAVMRSPLMVVAYERVNGATPPVVGVFVSHAETNEHLRRVEPAEHDKWLRQRVAGLIATSEDIRIAKAVREERDMAVNSLRAPEPAPIYGITAFSQYFPAVDVKTAKPKPPRPKNAKKQRLVRVHLVHPGGEDPTEGETIRPRRNYDDNGDLRAEGLVKFWLDPERAEKVQRQFLDATITIGARVEEDGSSAEWYPSTVEQKILGTESRFTRLETKDPSVKYEGRFLKGEAIYFSIESDSYNPDWTMELVFDCSPWDVAEPSRVAVGGDEL
jgi:hypothetical protein